MHLIGYLLKEYRHSLESIRKSKSFFNTSLWGM